MSAGSVDLDVQFDELYEQVDTSSGFGHREHLHLTWLAVRQHGESHAVTIICHGIRRAAVYAKAPQKYNATISQAWVRLVAHHIRAGHESDFSDFIQRNPALLDKRLLSRYYRSSALASVAARTGWVAPDLAPLPASW
ncbi:MULTISPECIES: hypothetical protein [unclassified Microbacterium]|uniref:hypothetical protein n=1 Tax=unclassified Microbacterium TaxID=2609290 RepID=UPI00214AF7DB|nr:MULTISPECIES: hypothetical protein [unclassified Microbacterium]MCR2783648.1 hypothetical protein [Microbacterium sp. zg.B96]WIM15494.1 hypothetical protein QNO11_13275 [Microbacterium sp. zg-B96]